MRKPRRRKLPPDTDIIEFLKTLDAAGRRAAIELLGQEHRDALDAAWPDWSHAGQTAPSGDWSTWIVKGGRGFGKTLAGAKWIESILATREPVRIALVGATIDDARRIMVEGKSGLIAVAGGWIEEWIPSFRRMKFHTGAEAVLFSGASPEMLRGPEHHYAWCDELAKWEKPQESWDMLQLGLRLGTNPRALITTTPRPGPVLEGIMADPDTVTTGGATRLNPHISPAYKKRVERLYAGTRLGRQELEGEMLPDAAGALWSMELIERCRGIPPRASLGEGDHAQHGGGARSEAERATSPGGPDPSVSAARCHLPETSSGRIEFARVLIAVDPPTIDGTCGIVAVAREGEGRSAIAHVLADHSVTGRSPEGWASAVAAAAAAHGTDEVIAEVNQGGRMVKAILLTADPRLRVRTVNARLGKTERAEPVAHLFEAGRVVLHGRFEALEAQLRGMIAGGGYEGPGDSPDRADAMVWGVAEVMRGGEVRVGRL